MTAQTYYPVLLAETFKEKLDEGGKVEFEVHDSKGALGFAWRVYIVDPEGNKFQLVRKKDIQPHELMSPVALIAFGQKFGLTSYENVPIPDPDKYNIR